MNSVNLIGNLVADPELKGQNNNVVNFRVAVQRQFKNKQTNEYETDFINCVAFGRTAEIVSDNFTKGNKLGVTGSIQTGSYENKEGQKVFTTDVIVNNITFVESKKQKTVQQQSSKNDFDNINIDIGDDLPF
ncbi:single-strand DNA-binding protein [Staphylococcus auricularis]|uniref:Single-stranded DNA-binding protein n=1 Tax=Staphylococcus auricularis TaxID=29379 RepID=A0AAW7MAL5_9STAP|nr:single-stranded DNA-binding protein [Staphylococcus auricularis]MBM0868932.1 single-stranded DNA-binding protein [Staphylococcus auricularis]MCG7342354.1 single-stranded DNA-binding protein [Staphylococcus auricularis]MDC6328248.1 single-stranded DNA-binding protein [Staphylococcus auricularis]MDN4532161.1 single-stranded DNA-binding protein [Staphylococcus auricularis]